MPPPQAEDTKQRAKPRKWTSEEENLFVEALDIFGRDWRMVAEHIKTRDSKAVKSHAQKYFIKLYKENRPLPAKVKEKGDGYTLSGKPLDPNSATARAYGVMGTEGVKQYRNEQTIRKFDLAFYLESGMVESGKIELKLQDNTTKNGRLLENGVIEFVGKQYSLSDFEKMIADTFNTSFWESCSLNGSKFAKVAEDCAAKDPRKEAVTKPKARKSIPQVDSVEKKKQKCDKDLEKALLANQKKLENEQRKAAKKAKSEAKKAKDEAKRVEKAMEIAAMYDADGLTEYSKSRSRRRVRKELNIGNENTLHPQFVSVDNYTAASQPFKIIVHKSVYVSVTSHCHLSLNEVIGFLAGKWEPEKATLTVVAAYPGRSTLEESTECELDPESAVELTQKIEEDGMQVVGWYHSHPTFEPTPSNWDVTNQRNYQCLFKDYKFNYEPFVGLIWSPFDYDVNGMEDFYRWFYIDPPTHQEKAMFALVDEIDVKDFTKKEYALEFLKQYVEERATKFVAPIDFFDVWKPLGGKKDILYKEKIEHSLQKLIPEQVKLFSEKQAHFDLEDFLNFLVKSN